MTLIIGFGSKARQGKDIAVQAIVDYYTIKRRVQMDHGLQPGSPYAQRVGFADALYDICRKEHGMTTKDAPLLQRIGMERRAIDELYWVKKAFAKFWTNADIRLISDVRYKNEADYIKQKGGYLVKVSRLNQDGTPYIADDRPADHPSEIDLDDYNFDFHLMNSHGHQGLLAEQAVTLAEYLRGLGGR